MDEIEKTATAKSGRSNTARHRFVALSLICLVAGMIGLSYAAVPLYRIFCQVTGYGGTTQKAEKAPDVVLARKIRIRFDANVSRDMPWKFRPIQRTIDLKIGETALVFYEAHNVTKKPIRGTATFNVTPEVAGSYFNKIECFCFKEQTLKAGERTDMPVTFFVDPEIAKDPATKDINEITLSYTFFLAKDDVSDVSQSEKNTKRNQIGS